MHLKISQSSFLTKSFLIVTDKGVKYCESSMFGSRRARFHQIEYVLLSPENKLSLQVGNEVFSIPVKPGNPRHQAAMDALLQNVRQSAGEPAVA